jgi:hypothetical protein
MLRGPWECISTKVINLIIDRQDLISIDAKNQASRALDLSLFYQLEKEMVNSPCDALCAS